MIKLVYLTELYSVRLLTFDAVLLLDLLGQSRAKIIIVEQRPKSGCDRSKVSKFIVTCHILHRLRLINAMLAECNALLKLNTSLVSREKRSLLHIYDQLLSIASQYIQ